METASELVANLRRSKKCGPVMRAMAPGGFVIVNVTDPALALQLQARGAAMRPWVRNPYSAQKGQPPVENYEIDLRGIRLPEGDISVWEAAAPE